MGWFSSDTKTKVVDPLAGQKITAADYLTNLLNEQAPLQQVAGMTDTEKYGQDLLSQYVKSDTPQGYTESYDYYSNLLNQPSDITKLPEYEAIINSVNAQTNDAVNSAVRRTQLGGMSGSTPGGRAVGREIALGGQNILAQLAPLAENERNRKTNAASALSQLAQIYEAIQQNRLSSIQQYGGLPRQIGQAELDAIFNQQMFPWTTQANVANSVIGQGVDYALEKGPSEIEKIASIVGLASKAAQMVPAPAAPAA